MFSRWAYILIGNNNTGKTAFQKHLLWYLCGQRYDRLPRNIINNITHPRAPRALATIFTCNRSFQENLNEYRSVELYFQQFFRDADICILSSHVRAAALQIGEMVQNLKRRYYNVAGVFWSNAADEETREIALLPWNETLWIDNPILTDQMQINLQLEQIARHFTDFLIGRSQVQ